MVTHGYLLPTRGVVLSSDSPETLSAKTESDIIGLAERAETLGFGSVWVGDSVLAKPRLEPLSTLAGIATVTEAVQLGTAVYLPNLRHPVNVAHLTATVDQLSGGRLALGVGVGSGPAVEAEHSQLDVPFSGRGRRLDELLDCLTALWTGDAVDYDGEVYELNEASIGFSPSQPPPIYVASTAFDPEDGFAPPIRDRIVAHGGGWIPIGLSPDTYAAGVSQINTLLEKAGRAPGAFDHAFYMDVVINEDEAAALDTAREFYDAYYPSWDRLSDDEIRARGAFGPAKDVRETIEAYADAGVENLVVRFTAANQRAQLARYADTLA